MGSPKPFSLTPSSAANSTRTTRTRSDSTCTCGSESPSKLHRGSSGAPTLDAPRPRHTCSCPLWLSPRATSSSATPAGKPSGKFTMSAASPRAAPSASAMSPWGRDNNTGLISGTPLAHEVAQKIMDAAVKRAFSAMVGTAAPLASPSVDALFDVDRPGCKISKLFISPRSRESSSIDASDLPSLPPLRSPASGPDPTPPSQLLLELSDEYLLLDESSSDEDIDEHDAAPRPLPRPEKYCLSPSTSLSPEESTAVVPTRVVDGIMLRRPNITPSDVASSSPWSSIRLSRQAEAGEGGMPVTGSQDWRELPAHIAVSTLSAPETVGSGCGSLITGGHTEYHFRVQSGHDVYTITTRYKQLRALHRSLCSLGMGAELPALPPKHSRRRARLAAVTIRTRQQAFQLFLVAALRACASPDATRPEVSSLSPAGLARAKARARMRRFLTDHADDSSSSVSGTAVPLQDAQDFNCFKNINTSRLAQTAGKQQEEEGQRTPTPVPNRESSPPPSLSPPLPPPPQSLAAESSNPLPNPFAGLKLMMAEGSPVHLSEGASSPVLGGMLKLARMQRHKMAHHADNGNPFRSSHAQNKHNELTAANSPSLQPVQGVGVGPMSPQVSEIVEIVKKRLAAAKGHGARRLTTGRQILSAAQAPQPPASEDTMARWGSVHANPVCGVAGAGQLNLSVEPSWACQGVI